MLEKHFRLKENNTTVKTEVAAGITTFMTMAYILAVNPSILGDAGMDPNAVLIATCLASFIGTILMGLSANLPFALSAGMGLNAYLAYTVVLGQGISWQVALFAVFVEGLIFIVLSLTNVREAIFNAIPLTLKKGVSVGIGLFIAFIGLQNAGLCVDSSTLVTITSFKTNFSTSGICALLAVIGIIITAVLYIKNVRGSILIGIIVTWGLGMLCQLAGIYVPNPEVGAYSLFPSGIMSFNFSALGETFGQCFKIDFSSVGIFNFVVVIFSFLFVDLFDTLGTLIGVATKADMLDEEGHLPNIKPALMSDAVATSAGAILGTSTVTTFVEASSGVAEGGRTGLSAMVTAALFFIAMFLSPVAALVPGCATATALIYVGILMVNCVKDIDWTDVEVGVPAFLAMAMMPFTYNISYGIAFGLISYIVIKLGMGKIKEIKVGTWIIGILFTIMFFVTH